MARLRRVALIAVCSIAFALGPQLWLMATTQVVMPETATRADAALIFGAIVRDGAISALHGERLDAGVALYRAGKAGRVVVSNTADATPAMVAYLVAQGVPRDVIEVDNQAERTPDTCAAESRKPKRRVLMVSQRFHLPRLALHCAPYGLEAQLVVADSAARAPSPWHVKARVRGFRLLREAGLTWGQMLRLYPRQ